MNSHLLLRKRTVRVPAPSGQFCFASRNTCMISGKSRIRAESWPRSWPASDSQMFRKRREKRAKDNWETRLGAPTSTSKRKQHHRWKLNGCKGGITDSLNPLEIILSFGHRELRRRLPARQVQVERTAQCAAEISGVQSQKNSLPHSSPAPHSSSL